MKSNQHNQKVVGSSSKDLETMLQDERKSLFMNRRDSATKQLDNPSKIRQVRKNIARIYTEMRKRELAEKGK